MLVIADPILAFFADLTMELKQCFPALKLVHIQLLRILDALLLYLGDEFLGNAFVAWHRRGEPKHGWQRNEILDPGLHFEKVDRRNFYFPFSFPLNFCDQAQGLLALGEQGWEWRAIGGECELPHLFFRVLLIHLVYSEASHIPAEGCEPDQVREETCATVKNFFAQVLVFLSSLPLSGQGLVLLTAQDAQHVFGSLVLELKLPLHV